MVRHVRKKGHGIIDTLKKAYSHAQTGLKAVKAVSDITGVKPSEHIKQKLISSALKSAGLGRKRVHHRKRGGCMGQGVKGEVGNIGKHMAETRIIKKMGGKRVGRVNQVLYSDVKSTGAGRRLRGGMTEMMSDISHVGGLQTQSGVNNYPNAGSIGVARF